MEKVYHKPTNSIVELTLELKQQIKESNTTNEYSKILALPEHFSPKHLQAIVDGKLKDGDKAELFGPIGNFVVNDLNKDLIFLSSGTGISAFVSMISSTLKTGFKNKIILIKSFRDESEILYEKEFSDLEKKYKNFKFCNVLSRPKNKEFENKGYMQDFLNKYIPKNFKGDFYICGLSDMVAAVKEKLISLGFKEERIFYEKYD